MEPNRTDAHRWAQAVCRTAGFEPRVQFESPDPYVHRRLVEQGLAAALLPDTVAEGLAPMDAQRIGLPPDMHRTLLAFVRRGSERAPAIRACRAAIESAVRQAVAVDDATGFVGAPLARRSGDGRSVERGGDARLSSPEGGL
jgi:DNA-binding transcriptional LysR family regulator